MSHKTVEGTFEDGRWRLRTTDDSNSERFVSSCELPRSDAFKALDRLAMLALGQEWGEVAFETILHDETGWVLQPDGRNAVPAASKEEARVNHDRIVLAFFGSDS